MHHMSAVRISPLSTKQHGCCSGNERENRETVCRVDVATGLLLCVCVCVFVCVCMCVCVCVCSPGLCSLSYVSCLGKGLNSAHSKRGREDGIKNTIYRG